MKQINYPNFTEIRLKNRRVIVGKSDDGRILVWTKNLIKWREIRETNTFYSTEGAQALFIALKRTLFL